MVARIYFHGWKMVLRLTAGLHDIADRQSPPTRVDDEYLLYVSTSTTQGATHFALIMACDGIDMGRMPGPRRLKWHFAFKAWADAPRAARQLTNVT